MNYSYNSLIFSYTNYLNEIIVRLSKFSIPSHIRFITKKLPNNNNGPFIRINRRKIIIRKCEQQLNYAISLLTVSMNFYEFFSQKRTRKNKIICSDIKNRALIAIL